MKLLDGPHSLLIHAKKSSERVLSFKAQVISSFDNWLILNSYHPIRMLSLQIYCPPPKNSAWGLLFILSSMKSPISIYYYIRAYEEWWLLSPTPHHTPPPTHTHTQTHTRERALASSDPLTRVAGKADGGLKKIVYSSSLHDSDSKDGTPPFLFTSIAPINFATLLHQSNTTELEYLVLLLSLSPLCFLFSFLFLFRFLFSLFLFAFFHQLNLESIT